MDLHVTVAQLAPRKRDFGRNMRRLGEVIAGLVNDEAGPTDVLVLPEMALTGYFLQGGVLEMARTRDEFFGELQRLYVDVAGRGARPLDVAVGFPERDRGRLYNSALYATLGGESPGIVHVHRKFFLPTYGVFDEKRYVNRGRHIQAFETRAGTAGLLICEDAWHSMTASILALRGAGIIYIPIASPARGFTEDQISNVTHWQRLALSIAQEHGIYVVTSNLVGFEGGKGFIGSSVIVNPFGEVLAQGTVAQECLVRARLDLTTVDVARAGLPLIGDLESQLPDLLRELAAAGAE
jgi:predicted amidohydrolase